MEAKLILILLLCGVIPGFIERYKFVKEYDQGWYHAFRLILTALLIGMLSVIVSHNLEKDFWVVFVSHALCAWGLFEYGYTCGKKRRPYKWAILWMEVELKQWYSYAGMIISFPAIWWVYF